MGKRNAKVPDLTLKGRDGSVAIFKLSGPQESGRDDLEFGKVLRDAIIESGLSQYQLAKVAEVPQGAISVFLGGGDLRLSTFNRLARVMGLELHQNHETAPEKIERKADRPNGKAQRQWPSR